MRKTRKLTEEHKRKIGKAITGSSNGSWKGEKVGYKALHAWLNRELGTPKYCAHCQSTKAKRYEWCNISKAYRREFSDWIRLCTTCHHKFDGFTQDKTTGRFIKISMDK